MYELTCRNHTGARYLTKNPYQRGLHFVTPDPSRKDLPFGEWECPCEFSDLVVVKDDEKPLPVPVPVRDFEFRSYH